MLEKNLLKTKAFQHGDNRIFSSRKGAKRGLSAGPRSSFDLMPDSRLQMQGMLDCRSIGDHVPLIGNRWAEPSGQCAR